MEDAQQTTLGRPADLDQQPLNKQAAQVSVLDQNGAIGTGGTPSLEVTRKVRCDSGAVPQL